MTTYIKFDVNQHQWSTGGKIEGDEWSRDSCDGVVSIAGAQLVKEDGYDTLGIDEDVKIGSVIYLVWAQYQTGDSFGNYGGQYELLKVFTNREQAEASQKYYETLEHDGSYGAKGEYVPWFGYFERLDGVYVKGLVVM